MEEEKNKGEWFVVHTLSGHENKIKENMLRKLNSQNKDLSIYEIIVPTEKVSEVRQGKKTTTTRKFFPGYILIRMDLYKDTGEIDENVWYFVRHTQGVLGFLGGGNKPIPLAKHEIEDLLNEMNAKEEAVRPKISFEEGETVRIKTGPFENFEGVIQEVDIERGKLKLMVSIFGRSTPVELEFWQVEKET